MGFTLHRYGVAPTDARAPSFRSPGEPEPDQIACAVTAPGERDALSARPHRPPLTPAEHIVGWLAAHDPSTHADGDPTTLITGLTLSSKRVWPGDLYAALPGAFAHGVEYAHAAMDAGAVAVLTDPVGAAQLPPGIPVAVVEQPRRLLGGLAAQIYGNPAARCRRSG